MSCWESSRLLSAARSSFSGLAILVAPRGIPHQLRNSGDGENHYLLVFWPSGFEGFLQATAVPAADNAAAPTKPPAIAVRNVYELAADYGIQFG